MEPASPHSETAQQLEQMRQRVAEGNPQLYRHWALYLQVLREGLGPAVERACFHLAVEVHPERYRGLDPARRLELHRRIAALVKRSGTLLTVEQLHALALQMQRRRRREVRLARRQWLEAMQAPPAQQLEPVEVPQGSVHLALAPPISPQLFGMAPPADPPGAAPTNREPQREVDAPQVDEGAAEDLMAVFSRLLDDAAAAEDKASAERASGDRMLPLEPVALLQWLEELEVALARRLRNLSHALNVELVRLGLSTSLLPLRLLEAVAAGQVDSQSAPANLARLSIPLPDGHGGSVIETRALLIRPSDLEAEQPPLRTCRSRLQQAITELRRMAQTYQRLERRLQANEAEQLWLNDHTSAQATRTTPPT